ncbi:plexin-A2-like [Amphiura filiformis]|uniref:plexin-A2-like n=1 Tax=Amphiura filiformis TaxID=82378 RepID=UPI003B21F91F
MAAQQLISLLLFVTFQNTVSLDAGLSAYELASYSVPPDCPLCAPKFNHFVIHKTTGDMYLGATNNLVHLNPSYQEINSTSTFIECPDDIDREDCINHNKLLIIHYDTNNEKLITCGNYDSGKCQIRDANDIEISMLVDQQVAAPGNLSTVYTIAPASTSNGVVEMLYVGATDPIVQDIKLFSRRRLSDAILSVPRDNELTLENAPNFQVDFKDVFDFNGFTYFVTNQRFDRGSPGITYSNVLSKINRVCHDSKDLDSRTEVVIECTHNGVNYNLIQAVHLTTVGSDLADSLGVPTNEQVLIGLFAKSVDPTGIKADNRSALCIFRLNDIEIKFLRAIAACLESTDGADGASYISGLRCSTGLDPNMFDTTDFADQQKCNALNYAHARGKLTESVQSTAIIEWPSTLVSSIITTIEEEHTLAFIGTSTGQLVKYHLRGGSTSRVYETLSLGSPVLSDDHLKTTEDGTQHLTVLTEKKIFKLRVENCVHYTTCMDCIGATEEDGDPYCGWCSLTRTCTRKTDCLLPDVSTRWLSYNEAQCLEISSVTPYDSQPYTVPQEITVTVEQLPDLAPSTDYECVFDYGDTHSLPSMATKSDNDLVCMTPPTNDLPEIPDGRDHITTLLSIRSTETGVKFVDTNHTFFECATHERCLDCARSVWDCVWCVYGDVCSHDKSLCPDDTDNTLIAGMEHHVPGPRQGADECAQLEMLDEEVLLAVGPEREIGITVFNLPDVNLVPVDSYLCILYIEGKEVEIPAVRHTVNMDLVRCQGTNHVYMANIQELTVNLTLHWNWGGTRRTIDDEYAFQVTLFKCEVDRPDCSRCVSGLTTRPELQCGWCIDSKLCAVEDHPNCIESRSLIRESGNENCPSPVITSIWPPSGPIQGNTLIDINGTDLGRGFDTIKSVMVAGRSCDLDKDTYEMSQRLLCITSMSGAVVTEDVVITVTGIDNMDQMNEPGTKFAYKDPAVLAFSPLFGPEAGGTKLKINGTSLVTGRYMQILIGNTACGLESVAADDTELTCSTGSAVSGYKAQVKMTYDEAERTSLDEYEYKDNPVIIRVQPNEAFKAGGRVLRVTGINLDVVQTPQVRVSVGGKIYTETCKVTNDNSTQMACPSPAVNLPARKRRQADETVSDEGVIATLGFIMDGVTDLPTWSENPQNNFTFEYFENPNYFPLNEEVNVNENDEILSIEGERLNLASTESDVQVWVGEYPCEVVNLGLNVLSCQLPVELINNTDVTASNFTLNVTIYQGNLAFENIGKVKFFFGDPPDMPVLDPRILIGIAVVAFLLLVLIIILTVIYQYREKRAKEQTLKLLHEMEKLEDSMAGRIRDAFAQLQLDLQDLTSDLEGTGMPFVTNEKYATNVLFSGINSKPSTKDPIDLDDRKERAMTEFCKLLEDKNFLLTFIRVLDEPRSAPQPVIRERTKFACFLTTLMIVEDKLPYLTDVMLTLLKGYIEEAVEEDKVFQLCQRTETVGERLLTNWVSICLFKYMKDQAAFPLFVLYRAILLQTEKGPVDIVNGKAYYSLSEHFVLQVDGLEYTTITLNVVVNDDGETKPLKVTNLDTVSQVKEKILDLIYRNKPYSQRPDVSLVDLEWRQGRAGRLILRDNDNSTVIVDEEFRKLNTLDHYKISDKATVALVVKQNVPNGTIDPTVLGQRIFVSENTDVSDSAAEAIREKTRNPRVSLFTSRARARFTVYELDVPMDDPNHGLKVFHLEKEEDDDFDIGNRKSWGPAKQRISRRVSAAIKQRQTSLKKIHYPQLLTTKGATQQYVNNMFDAVLDRDHIPKTIKYVFDFLEAEARTHNITESEILHKWKSSCLPLRYWVTIINNPQYVFDVRESRSVTSSLNVVAQAFFDAFNRTDHTNSKETGFNKLLYHRDLEGFQNRVDKYYMAVNDLDEVDTTEIAEELDIISQQFSGIFSRMSTLTQLYHFANINNEKLVEALEEDEMSNQARLAYRLEQVASILEGEEV